MEYYMYEINKKLSFSGSQELVEYLNATQEQEQENIISVCLEKKGHGDDWSEDNLEGVYVFALPFEDNIEIGLMWHDNNSTIVLSPYKLPWLNKHMLPKF